ncbi:MAG: hypothetical protein RLZZ01_1280 [Actinomycetota bacterium]|jgi:hypothetical protein
MIIAEAEADELELDADCLEQVLDDVGIDSLESGEGPDDTTSSFNDVVLHDRGLIVAVRSVVNVPAST